MSLNLVATDESKMLKTELDFISDNTNKAIQKISGFNQKHAVEFSKHANKFGGMVKELVVEPQETESSPMESGESAEGSSSTGPDIAPSGEAELSIHAQYLMTDTLNSLKKVIGDMVQEHKRPIHHLISRCGKAIDIRFYSDLSKLLKNEKEIENNPENLHHANRLILEHLVGLGRTDVADTFLQESEMSLEVPHIDNLDVLKDIMAAFKERNYLPAIHWVKENAPEKQELLFNLHCQHIIRLIESGQKLEALSHVKELQAFPSEKYKEELAHLMFVVISYPEKGPYEYLFHEGRWFALEEDLSQTLTTYRSSLATILNTGAKTVPSLMTMRAFLNTSRPGSLATLPDELPCNIPIPEQVHSSFCCPILKTQSTENNPPVRLCCGHVISTEAMHKLAQQSRNNRLKCPYCPLESVMQEAKVLYF